MTLAEPSCLLSRLPLLVLCFGHAEFLTAPRLAMPCYVFVCLLLPFPLPSLVLPISVFFLFCLVNSYPSFEI